MVVALVELMTNVSNDKQQTLFEQGSEVLDVVIERVQNPLLLSHPREKTHFTPTAMGILEKLIEEPKNSSLLKALVPTAGLLHQAMEDHLAIRRKDFSSAIFFFEQIGKRQLMTSNELL